MTLMTIMITIMTSIKFKINDICRLFYTFVHIFYALRSKQTVHGMCGSSDKAVFFPTSYVVSGSLARRFFFFFFFLYLRYATTTTKHSRPFGGNKRKKERKNPTAPFSLSSSFLCFLNFCLFLVLSNLLFIPLACIRCLAYIHCAQTGKQKFTLDAYIQNSNASQKAIRPSAKSPCKACIY